MTRRTDQEAFWEGGFGDDYADRNRGESRIAANTALFGGILARTRDVGSVLELGANIGLNLTALARLLPEAALAAVEINEKAASELRRTLPDSEVHVGSILDFESSSRWDLVFTKGVLIHIDPDSLPTAYEVMYRLSSRYLLVAEYYDPTPTEVEYRGHAGKLFKRDFAGEMLDRWPDLSLVDYGFAYHRDPSFPQDDITWFLMEKRPEG